MTNQVMFLSENNGSDSESNTKTVHRKSNTKDKRNNGSTVQLEHGMI